MAKREENREVAYLKDTTQKRLIEFVRAHEQLTSKSRVIELALDFYLSMAERYGLDDNWRPRLEPPRSRIVHAAEEISPYNNRAAPKQKTKGGS